MEALFVTKLSTINIAHLVSDHLIADGDRMYQDIDRLPEGWIQVTHHCGMPVYLHRASRVCTMSRPYSIGFGSTRVSTMRLPKWPHRQGGCRACWRLQDRIPAVAELHRFILCTRRSGGTAQEYGGCDQSIVSPVFVAIVLSWLWSTTTRRYPLGYLSRLLQVVDNWPHSQW